ncbi:FAST kinase domain-containing protein 2, mitochondrial-like [Clavelina lepadiformis]|uniref:FAST kinase domain-containing protein 2, mitochondrial-like n=1 Tax=Clavelina lepadiformis TaxID=159417 RepID=UPI00404126C2
MFAFLKSTGVLGQATKSWKLPFSDAFCCRVRPDSLRSPKRNLSCETFKSRGSEEAADDALSSYGDHDEIINCEEPTSVERPCTLDGVQRNKPVECLVRLEGGVETQSTSPMLSPVSSPSNIPKSLFSTDATNKDIISPSSEYSSSGVSSGILTQPSSMEFSDALANEDDNCDDDKVDKKTSVTENAIIEPEPCTKPEPEKIKFVEEAESTSEQPNNSKSIEDEPTQVDEDVEQVHTTTTNDELLTVIERCPTALDVLRAVEEHRGEMSPLLAVACIHYTFLKCIGQHERNSPAYNALCGEILTNNMFRTMVRIMEANCKSLNNFALLTAASDLLYLRSTLKKPTIPTLLSSIDYDALNLDELRLLAGCLHTPSIPLLNSEYMYNVAASVAMKHLDDITDLYTLLSIMKCFGRYFTNQAKRRADVRVASFSKHLGETYPDGRLNASHMFDAFYRMDYAPSRPLQLKACEIIGTSDVPLMQQDVTAILRYYVKHGFTMSSVGHSMLDKISDTLCSYMDSYPITQFTTNVKWLSVFYYYNEALLEKYVDLVRKDMDKLDFVALSDVLDALSQVYYLPPNAEDFFEQLNKEMLQKYPTLHRSNVRNVQRKLLLTTFHFSVFGRYPWQLIKLTLSHEQMQYNREAAKNFLNDFCQSLRIERPDLLPGSISVTPVEYSAPKLYAFENDVCSVLRTVVGHQNFTHVSSPVRGLPMFLLQQQLDGNLLPMKRKNAMFIPPHMHQTVQNVAVIPLPRSRFCIKSKHAIGKTRHALRLVRAQGARIVTVPHFDWDNHSIHHKLSFLRRKIFEQRIDDVIA